jgi:hypothetical protein
MRRHTGARKCPWPLPCLRFRICMQADAAAGYRERQWQSNKHA